MDQYQVKLFEPGEPVKIRDFEGFKAHMEHDHALTLHFLSPLTPEVVLTAKTGIAFIGINNQSIILRISSTKPDVDYVTASVPLRFVETPEIGMRLRKALVDIRVSTLDAELERIKDTLIRMHEARESVSAQLNELRKEQLSLQTGVWLHDDLLMTPDAMRYVSEPPRRSRKISVGDICSVSDIYPISSAFCLMFDEATYIHVPAEVVAGMRKAYLEASNDAG